MTGWWIALAAVVLALAVGAYRQARDGRFAPARRASTPRSRVEAAPAPESSPEAGVEAGGEAGGAAGGEPDAVPPAWTAVAAATDQALGERATLVQFSSAFCAPCRATRRVLGEVAAAVPGVVHVEIDAEQHLELVRALRVLRTPTTLVLDAEGREVTRAAGAPRKEQVLAALALATD